MKASVLAIGTELTTGQIINRNAATLSEKLKTLGILTEAHITVPDDRELILKFLNHITESETDLVFITGGLGPTSDDFTRDVVSAWAQRPLVFNEQAWQHIVERLTTRGFQVRDMQKQQCFFPQDSRILHNAEGTAHGFLFEKKRKDKSTQTVFVLPGPPREIESIWKDHLQNWFSERTQNLNRLITKAWDTIGVGESDVAYKVENVTNQISKSEFFEIGYRVHLPYVEVKVSFHENQTQFFKPTVEKIDHVLKDITVSRDFEDVVQKMTTHLEKINFTFYDFVTKGYLHTRLSPALKKLTNWSFQQTEKNHTTADFFEGEDQFLALLPLDEDRCLMLASLNRNFTQKIIAAPMKAPLMSERRKQYFSEMALIEFSQTFELTNAPF